MSQIISNKLRIFPASKISPKPNLQNHPVQSSDLKLKTTTGKSSQKKIPVKQILEKMKTSREPPQINDPFVSLKRLKVEPREENMKETEKGNEEKEKQREEELLALLIGDIMSG